MNFGFLPQSHAEIDEMMADAYTSEQNIEQMPCSSDDGDSTMEFESFSLVLLKPDGTPGPGIPLEGGMDR